MKKVKKILDRDRRLCDTPRMKTTMHIGASLHEDVARVLRQESQRTGKSITRIIEEALCRYLKIKRKPGVRRDG